jgi:hypothetical protein
MIVRDIAYGVGEGERGRYTFFTGPWNIFPFRCSQMVSNKLNIIFCKPLPSLGELYRGFFPVPGPVLAATGCSLTEATETDSSRSLSLFSSFLVVVVVVEGLVGPGVGVSMGAG